MKYNIHMPHMNNIKSLFGIGLDIPSHTEMMDGIYKWMACYLFLCACR